LHPAVAQVAPPVTVFIASRALLVILGLLAPNAMGHPRVRNNASVLPPGAVPGWLHVILAPWFRFDAAWYVGVAQHGYHSGAVGVANTNFMPVYPLLVRAASLVPGVNVWVAALAVANLGAIGAMVLLWTWANQRWDRETSPRLLILCTFFPFAFFLATPYAEPVFLCLAVASFLLAENDRWLGAITAAGLCTITRPVGIAVVLGIAALALARGKKRQAALASAGGVPLILFATYLDIRFGRPLGFLTYHSAGWVPPHGGVLVTVGSQFHTSLSPFDRIDAFLAALFLVSGILVWRRLGPGYGVLVVVGVLLPLVHGLVSMERYVVVLFPVMAVWASVRGKLAQAAIFGLSLLCFMLAAMMFAAGYSIF
jgi:hypothetical protein